MEEIKLDNIQPQSCDITDKGSSCCSPAPAAPEKDLKTHWDNAYKNSPEEKLGWYETDLNPTLKLIEKANLSQNARILNVGAGSTTLVDELVNRSYANIIATDISEVALANLQSRIGDDKAEMIVDDLTCPKQLYDIKPVDLWIDRAVLHFFTEEIDRSTYFDLLKMSIQKGGYVLLAQYNLAGAKVCAGLPIINYSKEILHEKLGDDFTLVDSFDYTYAMPSGDLRPYVYTLFKKQ